MAERIVTMYTITEPPSEAYTKIKEYFSRPGAELGRDDTTFYATPPCRYRTETGAACAVGCLLPDDIAKKADKHSGSIGQLVNWGVLCCGENGTQDFLDKAQMAHDGAESVAEFLTSLEVIAEGMA